MKIRCSHGYFIFTETRIGQAGDFMNYFSGIELVERDNYLTFAKLIDAPTYTIKGKPFLGVTATKTFEGEPWEVFAANGFVYDFTVGLLKPIASITVLAPLSQTGNRYVSNGLILPGSVTADGSRVKDYSAWFSRDTLRFKYDEVEFV